MKLRKIHERLAEVIFSAMPIFYITLFNLNLAFILWGILGGLWGIHYAIIDEKGSDLKWNI